MARAERKRVKNPEKVHSFKNELIQLYHTFQAGLEALCEKHDVKINYWYSPSTISQPKFIIDDAAFTADELYNGEEFTILATPTTKKDLKRAKKQKFVRFRSHRR